LLLKLLRCPRCRGSLRVATPYQVVCTNCHETYSQTAEIPDLRWPRDKKDRSQDPFVSQLLAVYSRASFAEMVTFKARQTGTATQLMPEYMDYALDLERGVRMYNMFVTRWQAKYGQLDGGNRLALDLGCGAGIGTSALAANYKHVIGLDPDLPSLIIAKKLFEEYGIKNVTLVQGYAQNLPLKSHIFTWCQAQNALEHLFDILPALQEVKRILHLRGAFCADSRNRFDLFLKEPHVKIRCVGWWPRSLMGWYVRLRTGEPYKGVHLFSIWELERFLGEAFGPGNYEITLPDVAAYHYSANWNKALELIRRFPFIHSAVLAVFPSHLVLARNSYKHLEPIRSRTSSE
jgi:ubiquinone/menaquinone biosynthesis C-methylase UbiE/uncharacterized protein YbaR (Trm112 family)